MRRLSLKVVQLERAPDYLKGRERRSAFLSASHSSVVFLGEERETKGEEIAISPWRGGASFPFFPCSPYEKSDLSLLPWYDLAYSFSNPFLAARLTDYNFSIDA